MLQRESQQPARKYLARSSRHGARLRRKNWKRSQSGGIPWEASIPVPCSRALAPLSSDCSLFRNKNQLQIREKETRKSAPSGGPERVIRESPPPTARTHTPFPSLPPLPRFTQFTLSTPTAEARGRRTLSENWLCESTPDVMTREGRGTGVLRGRVPLMPPRFCPAFYQK